MTSIMLSSNANSAMIQTIEASDSRRNPNVYSTETIYPAHAMTWVKCEKSSGTIGTGSQLNFQLQKYGIISQMLLCYEKVLTSATELPAGDFFKTIKQVELLASSKTVAILTAEDFMAQFSDCSQSQFNVVSETVLKKRESATTHKYTIPLTFGQMETINTQLDSSFLEPLSVRLHFNTIKSSATTYPATPAAAMPKCFLKIRYKNYDEPSTAEMISSNYSSPQLNQLTSRYYSESKKTETSAGASAMSVTVDLKNTECVEAFYVSVRKVHATTGVEPYALTAIDQVTMLASGQEICKLDNQQLSYARLSKDGWSERVDQTVTTDGVNVGNVAKIQLGLNSKQMMTNALSLREINNGQIIVDFTADGAATWEVCVVERVLAVYATSSSSGRYQLALAN